MLTSTAALVLFQAPPGPPSVGPFELLAAGLPLLILSGPLFVPTYRIMLALTSKTSAHGQRPERAACCTTTKACACTSARLPRKAGAYRTPPRRPRPPVRQDTKL